MRAILFSSIMIIVTLSLSAQTGPWQMPLRIAYSSDGISFTNDQIFQDSSGVPSITRDTNGVLVCAFQWFPAPVNSPHWDSVAVKFSYDNGFTWTSPAQCRFSGIPANFKRPFDPAIVCTDNGQFRMYFSCGPTGTMTLDTSVNTYSAVSIDGINFTFEPGTRYDDSNRPVIDPCVVKYNGLWHYSAPIGAPQDGAFHCTSLNGINFTPLPYITSDNQHVWGGNMTDNGTDIRFYGSTTTGNICYSATTDGNSWSAYTNTNLNGGDPAVYKTGSGNYIIVYVGTPYSEIKEIKLDRIEVFPNPTKGKFVITTAENSDIFIYNSAGQIIRRIKASGNITEIDLSSEPDGVYRIDITNKIYQESTTILKQ